MRADILIKAAQDRVAAVNLGNLAAQSVEHAGELARDDLALDVAFGRVEEEAGSDEHPLVSLFADLEGRFQPAEVKQKTTYYFSLGAGPEAKWSVQFDQSSCKIVNHKLDEPADCVMKTDVAMFTRIVREHYIPQMGEFLDGTVKTNDPELLLKFVSVFNL